MKSDIVILLLSCCITIATSFPDCRWTYCASGEGYHEALCAHFSNTNEGLGYDHFNGNLNLDGCGWFDHKRQCCKKNISRPGCKWSRCVPLQLRVDFVRNAEFEINFVTSHNRYRCNGRTATYECCPKE